MLGLMHGLAARLQNWLAALAPWRPRWKPRAGERHAPPTTDSSRTIRARRAEDIVARHLWLRGWKILARNVRNRYGELDIVARSAGRLHAVEVRSYVAGNPRPVAGLSPHKKLRLYRALHMFRRRRRDLAGLELRIWFAEVEFTRGGRCKSVKLWPLDYTAERRRGLI